VQVVDAAMLDGSSHLISFVWGMKHAGAFTLGVGLALPCTGSLCLDVRFVQGCGPGKRERICWILALHFMKHTHAEGAGVLSLYFVSHVANPQLYPALWLLGPLSLSSMLNFWLGWAWLMMTAFPRKWIWSSGHDCVKFSLR
jgi:hypothetical protein